MVPDTPNWIQASYVQNILRKTENDESINISKITASPATVKGDNFMSDIYRVSAEFSRIVAGLEIQEKRSLIVKLLPVDSARGKVIIDFGAFESEILTLSTTLPKMDQILTGIGMTSLSPRCLFMQQEKPVHLLFEDLASGGFRMADRLVGLDLDHSLLAIRNLGRFHASSIALKEKDPEAVVMRTIGLFHKDGVPLMEIVARACVRSLAKEACKWNELSPKISEKLGELSEIAHEKACQAAEYRDDEFNVFNHGDFWTNNILFKYDELGNPINATFVDFQLCHYGSPAVDIHYFWATSPTDNVRMNHRERVLREYHNSLTSTMDKLKCNTKALSFDSLLDILERRAFYEVIISIVSLPHVRLEKSQVKEFDELLSDIEKDCDDPSFRGSAYREIITRLLPIYDSMGLLDN